MKPSLNIGLIGHKFMGKAHSHALRDVGMFFPLPVNPVMHTLCGVEDDLEATANLYGWQRWDHDWRNVVRDPAIHVIAIATPGNTHAEIAIEAARRGKHVMCEKPLANTVAEAQTMLDAVRGHGVKHMVDFNYRRVPAVAFARQLIAEGRLGDIYQFSGTYQQDWPLDPEFPFIWRMDKAVAGAGSMADKGSHVIDLARYLVGEIAAVAATTAIHVNRRSGKPVTTDDAAAFLARFESGALGVFSTSRMSAGHRNALAFEVNGSRGSLRFHLERLNELEVFFVESDRRTEGFRTISVTQPEHPYVERWWPPGHALGWEHTFVHQYYEFLKAIVEDYLPVPDFEDGLRNQQVIGAIQCAAAGSQWVPVV